MIIIRNQGGGGIKKASKKRVKLRIKKFEINNLTLMHMYEIKGYEYFKNK